MPVHFRIRKAGRPLRRAPRTPAAVSRQPLILALAISRLPANRHPRRPVRHNRVICAACALCWGRYYVVPIRQGGEYFVEEASGLRLPCVTIFACGGRV